MEIKEKALNVPRGPSVADAQGLKEQRRVQRLAALKAIAGIWKDRDDIPKDGVEFQRALRAEWD